MNSDETYNGWKNRETWAFNLHWQNDQGLYHWVLDSASTTAAQTESDRGLGEHVVAMIQEELPEMSPELWELMREDVGSFWRVDHAETGACVRESLGGSTTCRHCGRSIVDVGGTWIDPEATGDDSVWRETCDAHDTFTAEHEPTTD